jgi:hypothetical protein
MNIARALVISVASAAIAGMTAATAAADFTPGTYNFDDPVPGPPGTWTVTPCGTGCVNVADPGGVDADGPFAPYSGQAHLTDGQWTMTVNSADAATCNDGSHLPGTVTYVWSDATLTGEMTGTITPAACGWADGTVATPYRFTLTRVG